MGLRAQRRRLWNLTVNSQKVVDRGEKLRHKERAFSQSELRRYLRGLQDPSDLHATPGPHQIPAWGAGDNRRGAEGCGDMGGPVVGTLSQLWRPTTDSPSSVRPLWPFQAVQAGGHPELRDLA